MERIVITTIEESVRDDSTKFEALLKTKTPEFKKALEEFSVRLDSIIGAMLKEYCDAENVEMNIEEAKSYKTTNRLITGKLDAVIGEHIKDKRSAL
ncbi:MAG: hypothetical protein K6A80_09365 [Saccharofermentans sp.]|nr:hypothetical protein [Saccharofermentans sp.]